MTHPLDAPPAAVLRFLTERMRTGSDGTMYFADDDGTPILDFKREGVPNADARAVAAWTRSCKPELWQDPSAPPAEAGPVASATVPTDLTNLTTVMAEVKVGRLSPDKALTAHFAARASATATPRSPSPPAAFNMTEMMTKARGGDLAARAALEAGLKRPGVW